MKTLALAILLGLFLACNNNQAKTDNTNSTDKSEQDSSSTTNVDKSEAVEEDALGFKIIGDSVVIPSFEIEIKLSEKAEAKLKADNETIIVAAYFSGEPMPEASDADKDDIYYLPTHEIELSDTRVARFDNAKFAKYSYNLLENKDISVLINVYSGRRSSENNILDCGILEEPISKVKGKRFTIEGKLIYGE